jgi:hypothetical protein
MSLGDDSCRLVGELLGRWYDDVLTEVESDLYEQHLLVCPPCLRRNDKLREALSAIPAAASERAPDELLRELQAYVGRRNGSGT